MGLISLKVLAIKRKSSLFRVWDKSEGKYFFEVKGV